MKHTRHVCYTPAQIEKYWCWIDGIYNCDIELFADEILELQDFILWYDESYIQVMDVRRRDMMQRARKWCEQELDPYLWRLGGGRFGVI